MRPDKKCYTPNTPGLKISISINFFIPVYMELQTTIDIVDGFQ